MTDSERIAELTELAVRLLAALDKATGDPAESDRLSKIDSDERLYLETVDISTVTPSL
jgi:hypothetical protein